MNVQLGKMHAASFQGDPKHLAFVLARYHNVARLLTGSKYVLEVGCGDCTGATLVRDTVIHWFGIDNDRDYPANPDVEVWDIVKEPYIKPDPWDAVYALDVLEHIREQDEDRFFQNINLSLGQFGTVIIGIPSLESQKYASELSKKYHVNCKDGPGLKKTLFKHYHNVYLFGMNDCALHTGFDPFCQYRFAIATGKK